MDDLLRLAWSTGDSLHRYGGTTTLRSFGAPGRKNLAKRGQNGGKIAFVNGPKITKSRPKGRQNEDFLRK